MCCVCLLQGIGDLSFVFYWFIKLIMLFFFMLSELTIIQKCFIFSFISLNWISLCIDDRVCCSSAFKLWPAPNSPEIENWDLKHQKFNWNVHTFPTTTCWWQAYQINTALCRLGVKMEMVPSAMRVIGWNCSSNWDFSYAVPAGEELLLCYMHTLCIRLHCGHHPVRLNYNI